MGRNKHIYVLIAARERKVGEHERKIAIERAKPLPNEELIAHWQAEMLEWEKQRARYVRRLHRNW